MPVKSRGSIRAGVFARSRKRGPGVKVEEAVLPLVSPVKPTEKPEEPTLNTQVAWAKVQLARHPERPHALDYIKRLFTDFVEMRGDRRYGDDQAIVGGLAEFDGRSVMVIGQQKGRDTKENIARNFGMPTPEGYRKALRLMQQAEKFGFPLFCFIDTPGAYPGLQSEERGVAQAIAENLVTLSQLRIPIITLVIGEGGSGGALAIGVGDRMLMLENSVYSVASPEASASILWRDSSKAPVAAASMKITAQDLYGFGIIDEIVPEPPGGAHTDHSAAAEAVREAFRRNLQELESLLASGDPETATEDLLARRYQKYRTIGVWEEDPVLVG
ncbi:MAG TPA: acetyl-CoA carboxylase carboxyltransferase subunit alpha [Chloroflexia bacterium]|nr:acetyl-CoA carboxylase carboxyltransferase subunit alpha [Chloroflexia bacterium]